MDKYKNLYGKIWAAVVEKEGGERSEPLKRLVILVEDVAWTIAVERIAGEAVIIKRRKDPPEHT